MDGFNKIWGERKEGVYEKGGERPEIFFFFTQQCQCKVIIIIIIIISIIVVQAPLQPSKLAAKCAKQHLLQQTALSEGMMDEEELPPPLRDRGKGGGDSADHTLYTSGDVGQEEWSFLKESRYSAGAGVHLWKTILGTKKNDCKLEMHFYDIVYQHEYSAWLLQAILISPMNNRARNWKFKHSNLKEMILYATD